MEQYKEDLVDARSRIKTLEREVSEIKREVKDSREDIVETKTLLKASIEQSKVLTKAVNEIGGLFKVQCEKLDRVQEDVGDIKKRLNTSEEKSKIDIRDVWKSWIMKGLVGGGFFYGIVEGIKKIVESFQ